MAFNAEKVKNEIVEWIRAWFEENGPGLQRSAWHIRRQGQLSYGGPSAQRLWAEIRL